MYVHGVDAFLSKLIGSNYASVDTIFDKKTNGYLLDGKIFLTHFQRPTYTPTREQLRDFAIRGAGILCNRNTKAIDLIIPVVLPPDVKDISQTIAGRKRKLQDASDQR